MSTTDATSTGVASPGGTAIFQVPILNNTYTPTVTPAGFPAGSLEHSLTYNAELVELNILKSALEACFKFQTDSTDITNADTDFIAHTDETQLPAFNLAGTNMAAGSQTNTAETNQTLEYDMVRYFSNQVTGGLDVVDFFSNETELRNDVAEGAGVFETYVRSQITDSDGKHITDGATPNIVARLLDVLLATADGRTRLFNAIGGPTGVADQQHSVPFLAGDKIKWVVSYAGFDVVISATRTVSVPARNILVTLNVVDA